MTTTILPLTARLLNLVIAVQSKRQLVLAEAGFREVEADWYPIVRDYIMALPLEELGLQKNEFTIRTLAHGTDSRDLDAARSTLFADLPSKFAFNPFADGVVALTPGIAAQMG